MGQYLPHVSYHITLVFPLSDDAERGKFTFSFSVWLHLARHFRLVPIHAPLETRHVAGPLGPFGMIIAGFRHMHMDRIGWPPTRPRVILWTVITTGALRPAALSVFAKILHARLGTSTLQ